MSTIPYQPTYKLQPQYGFRYGPSTFAPPAAPINAPPPLGLDGSAAAPPLVLGTQQGASYANDPFGDDNHFQASNQNRISTAQSYGYEKGVQSPTGWLRTVPVFGNYIADKAGLSKDPKYTYGDPGTYDNEGYVFDESGRGFDPITGQAGQTYAGTTGDNSWLGNWLGVGTDGGMFGSDSSYGKLRAAGENPVSSFLGSYDNSVYNVPRSARVFGYSPAEAAGLTTTTQRARHNQEILEQAGLGFDQEPELMDALEQITAKDLGFTDARPMPSAPSSGTYAYGTQTGDVFTTPVSYQTGVINESGQIETPTGTVVQTKDAYGNTVSLLGTPEENKQALQDVKDSFSYGWGSDDTGQDHGPSSHGGDTVGTDPDADDDSGMNTSSSNDDWMDDFGDYDGDWNSGWWSKGGKIPSAKAGGK